MFNRSSLHSPLLPNCTIALLICSDCNAYRIRTVCSGLRAGLARRGQWRRLVDYNRTPLCLSWRRRRGGGVQGTGLTLLQQAVVSQRSRRTEGLQSLGILVLGVGGRAGGSACRADTRTEEKVVSVFQHAAPVRNNVGHPEQRQSCRGAMVHTFIAHAAGACKTFSSAHLETEPGQCSTWHLTQFPSSAPADRCIASAPAVGNRAMIGLSLCLQHPFDTFTR